MAEHDAPNSDDGTLNDASGSDASDDASQGGEEDVSVLRSRFAGQTAKVNKLTEAQNADGARIKELEGLLTEARNGTLSPDSAAKALLAAKDEELALARQETKLARIEAKFPEVFRELGPDATGLSDEKLAAMEVRVRGGGSDEEPPMPRGQGAARHGSAAAAPPKEKSLEDMYAELASMPVPPVWGGG